MHLSLFIILVLTGIQICLNSREASCTDIGHNNNISTNKGPSPSFQLMLPHAGNSHKTGMIDAIKRTKKVYRSPLNVFKTEPKLTSKSPSNKQHQSSTIQGKKLPSPNRINLFKGEKSNLKTTSHRLNGMRGKHPIDLMRDRRGHRNKRFSNKDLYDVITLLKQREEQELLRSLAEDNPDEENENEPAYGLNFNVAPSLRDAFNYPDDVNEVSSLNRDDSLRNLFISPETNNRFKSKSRPILLEIPDRLLSETDPEDDGVTLNMEDVNHVLDDEAEFERSLNPSSSSFRENRVHPLGLMEDQLLWRDLTGYGANRIAPSSFRARNRMIMMGLPQPKSPIISAANWLDQMEEQIKQMSDLNQAPEDNDKEKQVEEEYEKWRDEYDRIQNLGQLLALDD